MKNIESFEFRCGFGGVEEVDDEVNNLIEELYKKGIIEVDIIITPTGKGALYSVIWDDGGVLI